MRRFHLFELHEMFSQGTYRGQIIEVFMNSPSIITDEAF